MDGSATEDDCIHCGAGRYNALEGRDAESDCLPCPAGEYQPGLGELDCRSCAVGSQTADGGAAFADSAAVACVACLAGKYSAHARGAEACQDCGPGSMTADTAAPADAVFVEVGAAACALCWATASSPSQGAQLLDAAPGARGYADLDADPETACEPCVLGTFVETDGQTRCLDFDECASSPCYNGATCDQEVLAHPAYAGHPTFGCACTVTGFSGRHCEFIDECALSPCQGLTLARPPAQLGPWPSVLRATPAAPVFRCPAASRAACTDPDPAVADDYVCTCPACADFVFSPATESLLVEYFASHAGLSAFILERIAEAGRGPEQGDGLCRERHKSGCTDPAAYNHEPTADVDDGSCIARAYGCRSVDIITRTAHYASPTLGGAGYDARWTS
jgi:hypothetical protein